MSIPKYAKTAPVVNPYNKGLGLGYGLNIVNPPVEGDDNGLPAEVTAGNEITVQDNSNVEKYSFEVSYSPYTDVAVNLTITAKESDVVKSNPVLKGTVIDEINAVWSYNAEADGEISSQTLSDSFGVNPAVAVGDRSYNYIDVSVSVDDDPVSVTIQGSDGRTSDSDSKSITFGNYIAVGVNDPSLLFESPSALQGIFDGLSKTIKSSQAGHSFNASGTSTEYMVIMHPASWGESEFTKGSFTGGYKRIHSVTRGGTPMLVDEVLVGDTENAININNGKNDYTEAYYVYMSEYPARTGDKPTVISKA